MAIVVENLSDQVSRIQTIEYRILDNVDQSVLSDWNELFEIANPQEIYPRQSYQIQTPEIREGRPIKVEVRATNGAGLQTVASKTILFQQPGSGQ